MLGTNDCGGNGMLGDDEEDLRDDLSGLPLERRMGVEDVRATEGLMGRGELGSVGGRGSLEVVERPGNGRVEGWDTVGEVSGEERGNGIDVGVGAEGAAVEGWIRICGGGEARGASNDESIFVLSRNGGR